MTTGNLNELKNELSVKAKNGIDFTLAASIIWIIVSFLWTLNFNAYYRSVFVFMAVAPLFPMALLFSKLLKTNWKIANNPLQPLSIWLNIAQLFYFPFLLFTMAKMPDYFIMVYAIITGAHLFPFSWLYKTKWYSIFAGIVAVGSLVLGLYLPLEKMYFIAIFTCVCLFTLTTLLYFDANNKMKQMNQ